MFKKIDIWILFLVILLSILLTFGFGVLVRQELVGSAKAGVVSKAALSIADIPANLRSALHSAREEDRFPSSSGFAGNPNMQESYLLFLRYSGYLKEGIVELVDLTNLHVLHTWNPDVDEFNDLTKQVDEFKFLNRDRSNSRSVLRMMSISIIGWSNGI